MSSPVAEAYLETIYNLSMEQETVRSMELAGKFRVSRPTVAETVKRLVDEGMVINEGAGGIRLTPEGRAQTEALLRRHRLAERLLFDVLGMDFVSAHEQAHVLEHWISPDVEGRISALLSHPETCPHGNPIPGNAPGGIEYLRGLQAMRLSDVPAGATVFVVSISEVVEDESAVLSSLMHTGIQPGARLDIESSPSPSEVRYYAAGSAHAIPSELAGKIWARLDGAPEA